jgi:chromosome segregation ATPase
MPDVWQGARARSLLETKIASLIRENESLNTSLLQVTNQRDLFAAQLQEHGVEPAQPTAAEGAEAGAEGGGGGAIALMTDIESKNRELAELRRKVQLLQVGADVAAQEAAHHEEAEEVVQIAQKVANEEREQKAMTVKFKNRQEQLEAEIRSIDDKVALKGKLLDHLSTQKNQFEKMKQQSDRKISQLEQEIKKAHKDKEHALSKMGTKLQGSSAEGQHIRQKYEDRISKLRKELTGMKQKQRDTSSHLTLQRKQQSKLKSVETEMESLKREKVNLAKRLKDDQVDTMQPRPSTRQERHTAAAEFYTFRTRAHAHTYLATAL